jgi:hypothetical protein
MRSLESVNSFVAGGVTTEGRKLPSSAGVPASGVFRCAAEVGISTVCIDRGTTRLTPQSCAAREIGDEGKFTAAVAGRGASRHSVGTVWGGLNRRLPSWRRSGLFGLSKLRINGDASFGWLRGVGTLASRTQSAVQKLMVGMRKAAQDVSERIQAQDERGRERRRACGWHKEGRTRRPLWRFQES